MAEGIETKRDAAVAALRDLVGTLAAEEARLTAELATVKTQHAETVKTLAALSGDAPAKRRRGRPKRAPEPVAA
jgi:hypothetical protein